MWSGRTASVTSLRRVPRRAALPWLISWRYHDFISLSDSPPLLHSQFTNSTINSAVRLQISHLRLRPLVWSLANMFPLQQPQTLARLERLPRNQSEMHVELPRSCCKGVSRKRNERSRLLASSTPLIPLSCKRSEIVTPLPQPSRFLLFHRQLKSMSPLHQTNCAAL